jgi:hypothetical protein
MKLMIILVNNSLKAHTFIKKGVNYLQLPYSYDYIKYLNDEGASGMTYDQWKYKSLQNDPEKCHHCGNNKDFFNKCLKCKY